MLQSNKNILPALGKVSSPVASSQGAFQDPILHEKIIYHFIVLYPIMLGFATARNCKEIYKAMCTQVRLLAIPFFFT